MKGKRVLVVDDSEIVLEMATDALQEAGFEVVTALNAKDANPLIFSPQRPDLIILDVMLPMLDGDKKARMLKDNKDTRDIPILLLSSKSENDLRFLVQESGADGFIRKPFVNDKLVAMVSDTIRATRPA
jgi:DNA-binding response OmpR family regulator